LIEVKSRGAPCPTFAVVKAQRKHVQSRRQEQLLHERKQDAYREKAKRKGPAQCRECGAAYRNGRWTWQAPQPAARSTLCPACRRTRDGMPAGYVSLRGEFFREHRDEILRRVRLCEQAEKREHPLQRILDVRDEGAGALVTTTGSHLARRIGEALGKSFKGEARYRYRPGDNLLRATWSR
jgi:hypothetical protein